MSESKKLILGLLTLGIAIYGGWFITTFFQDFFSSVSGHHINTYRDTFGFWLIHMSLTFTNLGLLIYYIKHLYGQNNKIKKDQKLLWVFYLILGSAIGMLIYWYRYIRTE